MINGLWGKKIGMTQVFHDNKVVPVTVVDLGNWCVTQIKTEEKDGYCSLQVGLVRPRYQDKEFSTDWLKKLNTYFSIIKEVSLVKSETEFVLGQKIDPKILLNVGEAVDAFGNTKGCGFQGVVKRYGWSGGNATHGSTFGRQPGSLGGARENGKVVKGKGMPGHMGAKRRAVQNLEIIELQEEVPAVLIKGSIPGKSGTLVFLRKCG